MKHGALGDAIRGRIHLATPVPARVCTHRVPDGGRRAWRSQAGKLGGGGGGGQSVPYNVHGGEALEAANTHHTLGGTVQALRVVAAAVLPIHAANATLRVRVWSDVP